jgi:transcriptional regulator with XRE-family HTH domain
LIVGAGSAIDLPAAGLAFRFRSHSLGSSSLNSKSDPCDFMYLDIVLCIWRLVRLRFAPRRSKDSPVPSEKSVKRAHPAPVNRLTPEHLVRVGAFVRRRREELGVTQAHVARALGYKSVMSVSAIEAGKEALAATRAYAWADILELRRDAFYLFAVGERDNMDSSEPVTQAQLLDDEAEVVTYYRQLPKPYQRQLRDVARALDALAREERQKR